MKRFDLLVLTVGFFLLSPLVHASEAPPAVPVISLSAAANMSVANDRMSASLRAEVENADPQRAANDANARMSRALARAKATAGVEVKTSGYSTYPISDKNQPQRWRVAQTVTLESADFATLAALIGKLQIEDQLLLSGMTFSVSPETRRKAEDALTQQAIRNWQQRAQSAAQGFGQPAWRTGRVTIQTGDFAPPQPMFRAQASAMSVGAAPVNVEAGNTEITVTVSGEAVLEPARPQAR